MGIDIYRQLAIIYEKCETIDTGVSCYIETENQLYIGSLVLDSNKVVPNSVIELKNVSICNNITDADSIRVESTIIDFSAIKSFSYKIKK